MQPTPAAARDAQEMIDAMSAVAPAPPTTVVVANGDLSGYHDAGLEAAGAALEDAATLGMTEL